MPPLTRRTLLQLTGASAAVGAAGCTSLGFGSSSPPRLGLLKASNSHTESHTAHALLLEDGDPVFYGSVDVDSGSIENVEGHPTEPANYVLYAWRDDQPRSEWRRFDFGDYHSECIGIRIDIDTPPGQSSEVGNVTIYSTPDCDAAPNESSAEYRVRRGTN